MYLFKERKNIHSLMDVYQTETNPAVAEMAARDLNIDAAAARQLHLNMLIYTIGIGTIYSVISTGISEEEIFRQQEYAYEAFLKKAQEGREYE